MDQSDRTTLWEHGRKNIIGVFLCIIIFFLGFAIHGNLGLYMNLSGFFVVVGGTLGAILLSYRMERLEILLKVLRTAYTEPVRSPDSVVEILVDLSVKRRLKGVLALQDDEEETTIVFLRQAIGMVVDGYSPDQIRDALNSEMYFFRMRRMKPSGCSRPCPRWRLPSVWSVPWWG